MFVYKISGVQVEMKAFHDDFGTYKSCSVFFLDSKWYNYYE